jgi:hypothetical protein
MQRGEVLARQSVIVLEGAMSRPMTISLLIVLAEILMLAVWFPQSPNSMHSPLQLRLNIQSL